ncbi:MAG: hypothetical protein P1S46_06830 [bacterium]|nr:hypothetical protein [bacterium]
MSLKPSPFLAKISFLMSLRKTAAALFLASVGADAMEPSLSAPRHAR